MRRGPYERPVLRDLLTEQSEIRGTRGDPVRRVRCRGIVMATLAALGIAALGATTSLRAQERPAPPSDCRGEQYRTYDYILGDWHNTEKHLDENGDLVVVGTGESHIHEIVDGCGIVEHRTSYRGGEEHARLMFLRAFDHERGRWSQVLTTDFPAYIVWTVERLDARRTRFLTSRILEGDTVHVQMTEAPAGPDAFRRIFESSRDGARTWALDVVVEYTRMGRRPRALPTTVGDRVDADSTLGRATDAAGAVEAVLDAMAEMSAATAPGGGGPEAYAGVLSENFRRWTAGDSAVAGKAEWVEGVREWWDDGWRVAERDVRLVDVAVRGPYAVVFRVVREDYVGPNGERTRPGAPVALSETWERHDGRWRLLRVAALPLGGN